MAGERRILSVPGTQRRRRSGPELEKIRREVAEYERFRDLVEQVTEVNEAICEARPAPGAPECQ
jgi:hypothetical protein